MAWNTTAKAPVGRWILRDGCAGFRLVEPPKFWEPRDGCLVASLITTPRVPPRNLHFRFGWARSLSLLMGDKEVFYKRIWDSTNSVAKTWLFWAPHANRGFPGGSAIKNPPAMQETWVWSLGREDPGGGNGNTLQYSRLGNPMDRGAWWATVHGVTQSQTWLTLTTDSVNILTTEQRANKPEDRKGKCCRPE